MTPKSPVSLRSVRRLPLTDAYAEGTLNVRMPAPRIDLDPHGPKVSVVIPAMNEARNLPWLAERMPRGLAEIVLVDGRSTDGTVAVARSLWPEVRVVTQTRRGKGNALACGFAAASGDIIVMLDADGSMDPGEIPYFVAALLSGADYAKGSRFTAGGGSSDITRFRRTGNRALNRLTGLVHRTRYTDLCYGYNAMWRHVLPIFDMKADGDGDVCDDRWGDGFEVETLMNIRVHLAGLAITEVPSFETPRLSGGSNLRAFPDGWRVLKTIAREHHGYGRGVRMRREIIEAVQRYRSATTAALRPIPQVAYPSEAESVHAATHAEPPGPGVTEQRRPGDVRSMSGRDLEVIDLTAHERQCDRRPFADEGRATAR